MTLPASWQNADILDGLDIEDKSKLIGIPFLITGCQFKPNNDGVSICYVDGEYADGSGFTFTDASTGVRAQLVAYLTERKVDHVIDTQDYAPFRLVVPNGLRVSEYDRPIRTTGPVTAQAMRQQPQKVKTYYLTTSGRRAGREDAQKTAPKTPATRAK
jgi:hypothetical protein